MINNEKKTVTYSAFMVRDLIAKEKIPASAEHSNDGKTLIHVCKNAFDLKSGALDKSKLDRYISYMSVNGYKFNPEPAGDKEVFNIYDITKKELTQQSSCTAYVFHAEINYASKDMVRDLIAQKIPASADHSGGKTWIHVCKKEADSKYGSIDNFKIYMSENGYKFDDTAVDYHKEVFKSYDSLKKAPKDKSTCLAYIFSAEINSDVIVRELLSNGVPAMAKASGGKTWIHVCANTAVSKYKSYEEFSNYMSENGYQYDNRGQREVYTDLEKTNVISRDAYIFYVKP